MKKYLPIKFYQKREVVDDRLTNAGGSKEDPKWVLTGKELEERSAFLESELDTILNVFATRPTTYNYIPQIISVELEDKAVAKSHRTAIKEVFNKGQEQNIIGFNNDKELLIRVNSVEEVKRIKGKLTNTQKYAKGISAISDIEPYKPYISDFSVLKESGISKVSLFNYFDYSLNQSVKNSFIDFCEGLGLKSKETFYTNDLIVFRLEEISSQEQYNAIINFPALEFITPMPKLKISWQSLDETESIDVQTPEEGVDYPIVGVLDSGISENDYLSPWIEGHSSNYPENLLNKNHGTFVGGIIAYGDSLEEKNITGLKNCKVFDAAVLPDTTKEAIEEDELLENIHEAVRSNGNIRIWNMSLGYENLEIDDCNFSQFAMALDDIQQRYDVIICKAGGNCTNFFHGKPVGKITVPSESVLSVVVGSVSNEGEPSVFSRTGFGSANICKPDLVSYGGNFVKNGSRYEQVGVKSFSPDGSIIEQVGTSFSTPRVAALLAGLDFDIADEFDPLLIKALAIHSAKYPEAVKLSQVERVKRLGYGIPEDINNILYNTDNEITLIQSDRLTKGTFLEILEFPFPESLIDSRGYYYGDITITLVTSPVLFAGNGSEYCQSDIDVKFGTFDIIKDVEISRTQRNEYAPDGLENLLTPDKYGRKFINADFDNPFTRERTLLKYGKKYQPVKKWHINLSELTPAVKERCLKSPKKWALRLTGLYRDFAETRAGIDGEQLFQDFCLIITIKDPNGAKPIYNEVSQLLESRNFIHNDIQLRDNIQIRI